MGKMAPEGWLYLEARIDEGFDAEGDPVSDALVVWACSPTCAASLWKGGPGSLDLTMPIRSEAHDTKGQGK